VRVRAATVADASLVAGLMEQFGYPATKVDLERRLERLASDRRAHVVVAELDGAVVGVGSVTTVDVIESNAPLAMLLTLVVDQVVLRRGVGRALVGSLERFARASGCFGIVVQSGRSRVHAHALYRALGYEQTGERFIKLFQPPGRHR
jgi:predicted N-acetyltransferase YhbS